MTIVIRCAFANCPIKVINQKYCDLHQAKPRERRGTAAQRGYDYQWQKYRKLYLQHNPICLRCDTELGVITAATV